MKWRTLIFASLAVLMWGCGQQPTPSASGASNSTAAAINPVETKAPAERDGGGDETSSAESSVPFSPIASALAATTIGAATPISSKWVEGKNYQTVVPAQPTGAAPDKVEVVEVFWYGCPHCYHLDPALEAWTHKAKPAYVSFRRVPVIWNDVNRGHARLFFTLALLNKFDALHGITFKEIHENHNPLVAQSATETENLQRAWLKKNGISDKDIDGVYHSFGMENELRKAEEFTRRYKVTGVPTFVINGKYVTDVAMAGSEAQLFDLIGDLASAEHKH